MTIDGYIKQALAVCLKMVPRDRLMVVTDRSTKYLGQQFFDMASQLAPEQEHLLFVMEDFGIRGGETPLAFPWEIAAAFNKADVSVYAAEGQEGELSSFRVPMIQAASATGRVRHGHMPGLVPEILELGFGKDYQQVVDLTAKVYDLVQGAKTARVTTELGTQLDVKFHPDYKWVRSDGIIKPGEFGNIPSGEVFTCVDTCEGTLVTDGEVGDFLCARYGILRDTPVTIRVIEGRAAGIMCDSKELQQDLEQYFQIDENANRIGEFAIGTNVNLTQFIGNLLLDEKFPGMHVAFGSGYPEKTGASWNGKAHLDCIVTKPTIQVDGNTIMDRGKFLI